MNKLLLITLLTLSFLISCHNNKTDAQQKEQIIEKKDTVDSIKKGLINEVKLEKKYFKDIPFYKELQSKLSNEKDTSYICSRHTLNKVNRINVTDSMVSVEHSENDIEYKIEIKLKRFNPKEHVLELVDTIWKPNGKVDALKVKNIIDNHISYGIDGNAPKFEIANFSIKINNDFIEIPANFYSDIYEINLGNTEAYYFNNETLFIYLNGSDAAGSYSVKYVIGSNGYKTRILAEYCGYDFIDGINYDCF
ncbi:MAG: hypothetical protein RBR74_07915 [Ignavibacteriaceae bacterium]|nr:hypothetical protein [Ignavibacteriaceae bacterium]